MKLLVVTDLQSGQERPTVFLGDFKFFVVFFLFCFVFFQVFLLSPLKGDLCFKIVLSYPSVAITLVGLEALALNGTDFDTEVNLRQLVNALPLITTMIDPSVRNIVELMVTPIRPALSPFEQQLLVIPRSFLSGEARLVELSGGKQNMSVRIAVAFVMNCEIAAHTLRHETLLAELSHQVDLIGSSLISQMESSCADFVNAPGHDFTRKSTLSFSCTMRFLLSMGGGSLNRELAEYFDFSADTVSVSALVQRRSKIRPEAFSHLLKSFNNCFPSEKLFCGRRLLSVDGSDIDIPHDPSDKDSFIKWRDDKKGYNLLHLNALYDLTDKRYYAVNSHDNNAFKERQRAY